ncbi:hypothetical protein OEZ86_009136 [Tetradesmus obliquus]|nr:hypothetical protein OEZ86_009136 [Tetradesmus obliquus]
MQLEPESLECSETCETPDAMDCMDYVRQDTLGDNFSGSHAITWRPDQSVYVTQNGNGCLNFGAPDNFQCNKGFLEAAQSQQAQQEAMCSTAGAPGQQQPSPRGFCCTYLSSTQSGHPYAVTRKYCGDDACGVGCSVPPIVSRDDPRVTLVAHKVKPEHGQQQQQ